MRFVFLIPGLLAGGGAATAAFGPNAGIALTLLSYTGFALGAVCFASLVWAMAPAFRADAGLGQR